MSTAFEIHETNLVSSSKLKLRAKVLLADGSEQSVFHACVLLHAAARLERRAVDALSTCPPETRLAGSIEECWCLLEGRDPDAAANVWGRILDEADSVPRATADSMLSRLRPRYDRAIREFVHSVQSRPALSQIGRTQILVPVSLKEQKRTLGELEALTKRYPGTPQFWASISRLAEVTRDSKKSWNALTRAIDLAPDNPSYRAMSLTSAVENLTVMEADRHLQRMYSGLAAAEPEICLMYAFAEMALAERSQSAKQERLKRALFAVNTASKKARSEWMQRHLQAVKVFLEASLAKRKADPDLLYRAGLSRLAATSGRNPIDALRAEAVDRVGAMAVEHVAA